MSLHDRCNSSFGYRPGETTGGEARTLAAIVHGIDPEEVESFLLISLTHCAVCGKHNVLLEKDMANAQAKELLANAIGTIIITEINEE